MSIRSYLSVLGQRWRWLVGGFLVTMLAVSLFTHFAPRQYATSAQVFVSVNDGSSDSEMYQGSLFVSSQLPSYRSLAVSPLILNPVIDELRLGETAEHLAKSIVVTSPEDTTLIVIQVTSDNPRKSADIANATADRLATVTTNLSPKRSNKRRVVNSRVLMEAQPPPRATAPNVAVNFIFGSAAAIALGILTAVTRHLTDSRVRSVERLEALSDTPLIGTLPSGFSKAGVTASEVTERKDARLDSSLERLKTNFLVRSSQQPRTVLVTGTGDDNDKRAVLLLLASELGRAGESVCILDADHTVRNSLKFPELDGRRGLHEIGTNSDQILRALAHVENTSLKTIGLGSNVSEPLDPDSLQQALSVLQANHDVVLVNSPTVAKSGIGLLYARKMPEAVLVVSTSEKQSSVTEAIDALTSTTPIVSTVLVDVSRGESAPLGTENTQPLARRQTNG